MIKQVKVTIEVDMDNEKQLITLYSSKKQSVSSISKRAINFLKGVRDAAEHGEAHNEKA